MVAKENYVYYSWNKNYNYFLYEYKYYSICIKYVVNPLWFYKNSSPINWPLDTPMGGKEGLIYCDV